ncbi:MAG: RNA methyltransferase [Actinomycetia bacterium]|nr:RNA methyltransferase [Actinomycetes bacterium]
MTGTELKRLHREWRRRSAGRVALILDGVQNPINVGAILRSAAAYRVDQIWAVPPSAGPDHPRTAKTALGSERFVPWADVETFDDAAVAARAGGYRLVGIELTDDAVALHQADLGGDVCLVLGHEDRGLSKVALAGCDSHSFVPMLGKVGSLNVAHAATTALYEARRQSFSDPS